MFLLCLTIAQLHPPYSIMSLIPQVINFSSSKLNNFESLVPTQSLYWHYK